MAVRHQADANIQINIPPEGMAKKSTFWIIAHSDHKSPPLPPSPPQKKKKTTTTTKKQGNFYKELEIVKSSKDSS